MAGTRFPNLFIVGAPKCGTTALSHYLAGHPMIFMSEQAGVKEPNFYCPELNHPHATFPTCTYSIEAYSALFSGCTDQTRYVGEASAGYLYSLEAVPAILRDTPLARLIVMLRNPLEIAEALHNEYRKLGAEIASFEKAWRLQDARLKGRNLPFPFDSGEILQYGAVASTGRQVQRLLGITNKSQVFIAFYDDFAKNPDGVYRAVLQWLELPDDSRKEFPRLNSRVHRRSQWLEEQLRWLGEKRKKLGLPGGLGIHALIERFNRAERKPLRPAFRQELCAYFRDDVALLSRLLGRDLSHWLD